MKKDGIVELKKQVEDIKKRLSYLESGEKKVGDIVWTYLIGASSSSDTMSRLEQVTIIDILRDEKNRVARYQIEYETFDNMNFNPSRYIKHSIFVSPESIIM
jgi:hypothetical protein